MRRALCAALTTFLATGLLLAGPPAHAEAAPPATTRAAASTFTSVPPSRVLDTRDGNGPVGAGGTVTVGLGAHLPADATAVVLNVTGVTPTSATHVTVYPSDVPRPAASSLNLAAGDIRANQVTVAPSQQRTVTLYNNSGSVDLVVDVAGYYRTGAGDRFTALPPNRLLDTRYWAGGPVGAGQTRELDLTGHVPASATTVTFNLTATDPTSSTFVTAWPTGTTRPISSNLNTPAGDTRANLVTVALGADRKVNLYNLAGSVHLVVDLTGFYTPEYGASFVPWTPSRVLDTRDGDPVGPGGAHSVPVTAPDTAAGVLLNLTAVDATAPTHVLAWASFAGRPYDGSTLNLSPGQAVANAAVVPFERVPAVAVDNATGSVHLVVDVAGVFVVADSPACTADCLYAWGDNHFRKLGTGEVTPSSPEPTRVVNLSGVRAVAGGGRSESAYALRNDGTVWAWGNNVGGQLGNGWSSGSSGGWVTEPVRVLGLTGVTAISATGYNGFALRNDGTVWAWGSDAGGLLGDGPFCDVLTGCTSPVPVQVSELTDVVAIATNHTTAYAVRADGTVWVWGSNLHGALGNGSALGAASAPEQVPGLTGVTAIAGGGNSAYVLRADGTVWSWGQNRHGQLGNGQACDPNAALPCESTVPVQVSGLTGVTAVAGGFANGYAVLADGTVRAWGTDDAGRLGDGPFCEIPGCESRVPVPVSHLDDVTQVSSFDFGAYALRADGSVLAWGSDDNQSLGNAGAPAYAHEPVPVAGLPAASAVAGSWYSGYAIVPNP
jgi:alpha-tubulin suppressor-like RCC1 family protein